LRFFPSPPGFHQGPVAEFIHLRSIYSIRINNTVRAAAEMNSRVLKHLAGRCENCHLRPLIFFSLLYLSRTVHLCAQLECLGALCAADCSLAFRAGVFSFAPRQHQHGIYALESSQQTLFGIPERARHKWKAHIFLILLAFVQTDAAARRSLYTKNSPSCFYLDMSRHEFTISSSFDCISIAQVNINCFQIDYICTRFLYMHAREKSCRV